MYEAWFELRKRPFRETANLAAYFPADSIEHARNSAIRAISNGTGVPLVIGQPGTGKTLLCRLLMDYFRNHFQVVSLATARLCTRRALLQNILFEMGLPYRDMAEGELRISLMSRIREGSPDRSGLLVVVDEAHTMPLRLLDELRLMTNEVIDEEPAVRLLLVGGTELDEKFSSPKLDSFNQRVSSRSYLKPLTRIETERFVRHQIASAGGNPDQILRDSVQRSIFNATDGVPRLINQVCDHALQLAFEQGKLYLGSKEIEEAWSDLQQLPASWSPKPASTATISERPAFIEFGQLAAEEPIFSTSDPVTNEATRVTGTETTTESSTLNVMDFVSTAIGVTRNDTPLDVENETVIEFEPRADEARTSIPIWEHDALPGPALSSSRSAPSRPSVDFFEGEFEDEEVVVCRYSSLEANSSRGRPCVQSTEGRELAQIIEAWDELESEVIEPRTEFRVVNDSTTSLEDERHILDADSELRPDVPIKFESQLPSYFEEYAQLDDDLEPSSQPSEPAPPWICPDSVEDPVSRRAESLLDAAQVVLTSGLEPDFEIESYWAFDEGGPPVMTSRELEELQKESLGPESVNNNLNEIEVQDTPLDLPFDDRDIILVEDDDAHHFCSAANSSPRTPEASGRDYRQLFSRLRSR